MNLPTTNCANVMAVEITIEPMMITHAPTNMHLRRPSLSEMTALNGVATMDPLREQGVSCDSRSIEAGNIHRIERGNHRDLLASHTGAEDVLVVVHRKDGTHQ